MTEGIRQERIHPHFNLSTDCCPSYRPHWQAVNKSLLTIATTNTTDTHRPLLHLFTSNLKLKPQKTCMMSECTGGCWHVLHPTAELLHLSLSSVNLAPKGLINKETTVKGLDTQLPTHSNVNGTASIRAGKVTQKGGNSKHFLVVSKNSNIQLL